jgi:hypothetical protein
MTVAVKVVPLALSSSAIETQSTAPKAAVLPLDDRGILHCAIAFD